MLRSTICGKKLFLFVTLAAACLGGLATVGQSMPASDQSGQVVAMMPRDLEWTQAVSLPAGATVTVVHGDPQGKEPLTIRLKFPADYKMPAHTHPVTENVTVLSGSFHIGLGEKLDLSKGEILPVGGFVRVPAGVPHYAWTTEEVVIQLHSSHGPWGVTYVDPALDPRKKDDGNIAQSGRPESG